MPGTTPPTSQLEWLSSTTAMIVLFWSRAMRDLLKSFGWGIAGTPSIRYSDEVAIPRRPPHSVYRSRSCERPSGAANRSRRHERRSHVQVQARDGNSCLEWVHIAFPFAEGPRVRI